MAEETVSKKESAAKIKSTLNYRRDKDREMVRGIFRFHEVPGGTYAFSYRAYKGDPIEKFTLTDGEICTIPLGVAKHLNKNCWYPVHEYAKTEKGEMHTKIGRQVHRCSFQSLEFVDIEELQPDKDLVTVQMV